MSYKIVHSGKEVDRVLNWAVEMVDSGDSDYPAASYEAGVIAMFEWLTGVSDVAPDDKD